MENIDVKLRAYIENNILPIYEKNDSGHGIEHIKYVIKRSFEFANQFDDINLDMVYVIASFHDIAHHIDRNNHEILSAKLFYEDEKMKEFFTDEQRKIISIHFINYFIFDKIINYPRNFDKYIKIFCGYFFIKIKKSLRKQ